MKEIFSLDSQTIDKIAAGEVVDRPSSVVKELTENAIDAGANAITVEIKEGGISYIRVTDNGEGIAKSQVKKAFMRHATSKIRSIEDLLSVSSLGFRGEALSSISSVAKVELLTKEKNEIVGTRYVIEGSKELVFDDAGVPDGTTFVIRDLFFNTPARRKFLKSAQSEGSYVVELMEQLMMSNPSVSFKLIVNGNTKLQSSGNGEILDVIYGIYGRDVASNLIRVDADNGDIHIYGYVGKPELSRGNRNFEVYFVNNRLIKSSLISRALDAAYKPYLMLHKYPLVFLYMEMPGFMVDVNVHPAKKEVRFIEGDMLYSFLVNVITEALARKELIPAIVPSLEKPANVIVEKKDVIPEPFEVKRKEEYVLDKPSVQMNLFEEKFLTEEAIKKHRIIGQLFDTYWLIEYEGKLFIIDQHAAHEKVKYERILKQIRANNVSSQYLNPPIIISLSPSEEEFVKKYSSNFAETGFLIEHFGGHEFAISAVPLELYREDPKDYFHEMLDELSSGRSSKETDSVNLRIATMACKSAVKGNTKMSVMEADELITELLTLDNPYNCPHGRPTIVSYSKYDIEKMFKRIVT